MIHQKTIPGAAGQIKKRIFYLVILVLLLAVGLLAAKSMLQYAGRFLVVNTVATEADALVVLNTGSEYYPRLLEAADRYRSGQVKKIILNGNRKTPTLRKIEQDGFHACCPWDSDWILILHQYGVPREDVITISIEDAYDTISEARALGGHLAKMDIQSVLVVTSKYHSRRAGFIWRHLFTGKFAVFSAASRYDPFNPENWWSEGRQVRWVMAEYGAWVFLGIQRLQGKL